MVWEVVVCTAHTELDSSHTLLEEGFTRHRDGVPPGTSKNGRGSSIKPARCMNELGPAIALKVIVIHIATAAARVSKAKI